MMKTQQELQKIERELAEQMQAMEARIGGLTETVKIDQLQGQIEGTVGQVRGEGRGAGRGAGSRGRTRRPRVICRGPRFQPGG